MTKAQRFIFYTVMGLFMFGMMVFTHETIHKFIYEDYGCKDVSMGVSWYGFYTQCNDPENIHDEPIMEKLHNYNEIAFYYGMIICDMIFLLTIIVVEKNKR